MATLTTSYQLYASQVIGNTGYSVVTLRCYAKYNSQDVTNKKTNISVQTRLYVSSGSFYSSTGTSWYAGASGLTTASGNCNGNFSSGETTLGTLTGDIAHNADGTKSIDVSSGFVSEPWGWAKTITANVSLPTINVTSKFTSGTSVTIANNGNIDIYPTFSKAVNSYYQTLSIKTTDQSTTLFTLNNVSSGTHYYPDATQRQKMYDCIGTSDRYVFSLVLNTYVSNGGQLVGTDLVKKVPILPNYSISITGTMEDTVNTYNTYKPSGHTNDTFIRYLSKPKFTLTATSSTGSYYGRSVSYKLGSTAISNPYTENNYTGQSFSFTATDGRKTSSAYTPSPTVIQYFEPTLNVSVVRTTPTGSTIDISISGTYYSGTGLTNLVTPSVALVYTESGGSQVSTTIPITTTTSGNIISFTGTKQLTGMNYQKSVQWAITLTDRINRTNTKSGTLTQGLPVWNGYRKNDTNYFNVNGKLLVNNKSLEISNNYGTSQSDGYSQEYINNKLTPSNWITINDSGYGCYYKKMGNLVTIRCYSTTNLTLNAFTQTQIGTVPTNARPSIDVRFAVWSRGRSTIYGNVSASTGALILFNWDSQITFEAGQLGFTVTYLI